MVTEDFSFFTFCRCDGGLREEERFDGMRVESESESEVYCIGDSSEIVPESRERKVNDLHLC